MSSCDYILNVLNQLNQTLVETLKSENTFINSTIDLFKNDLNNNIIGTVNLFKNDLDNTIQLFTILSIANLALTFLIFALVIHQIYFTH